MRYQLGQKILTCHIDYQYPGRESDRPETMMRRISWIPPVLLVNRQADDEHAIKVTEPVLGLASIFELTVTGHVKVPSIGDPEKNYDAYILRDQFARPWVNQYPKASYGRATDDAVLLFRRAPFVTDPAGGSEATGVVLDNSREAWKEFFAKAREENMPVQSTHLQCYLECLYGLQRRVETIIQETDAMETKEYPAWEAEKHLLEGQIELLKAALHAYNPKLAVYVVERQPPAQETGSLIFPTAIIAASPVPFSGYEDHLERDPFRSV